MAASGARVEDTPSGAAPLAPTAMDKKPLFPDDVQFWYETQRAFGAAEYGGAQFGEVLATSARIKSGDYDSWYDAWNDTADRTAKEAADQHSRDIASARGRPIPIATRNSCCTAGRRTHGSH